MNLHQKSKISGISLRFFAVLQVSVFLASCGQNSINPFSSRSNENQNLYSGLSYPRTIYIDENTRTAFPREFEGALLSAISDWNQAAGTTVLNFGGRTSQAEAILLRYAVSPSIQNSYFGSMGMSRQSNSVIGRTEKEINPMTHRPVRVQIYLDPSKVCLQCGVSPKYVILHELGHLLGLADNQNPASVMYGHYRGILGASSNYNLSVDRAELQRAMAQGL